MASIKPDGSDLKILGAGHDPCLSPDGKHIAYTGEAPGGVSVFVMDADGSNKQQIVKDVNPWGEIFPSWSPDGKQIVYSFKMGEALMRPRTSAAIRNGPRSTTETSAGASTLEIHCLRWVTAKGKECAI